MKNLRAATTSVAAHAIFVMFTVRLRGFVALSAASQPGSLLFVGCGRRGRPIAALSEARAAAAAAEPEPEPERAPPALRTSTTAPTAASARPALV